MIDISFNEPYIPEAAAKYLTDCLAQKKFEEGKYIEHSLQKLRDLTGAQDILLTPSCTDALEMAALLLNIQSGDEVIMPSYTFASTANAFALRGAKIVFVDINPETLNIDPCLCEEAITEKTKAIVIVHYAGIACDLDKLLEISGNYKIPIIEDAAQCIDAYYKDQHLGTFGDMATFSFHHTKNISSGLGGALIINEPKYLKRANVLYSKGTNRQEFLNGEVDKYTWVDIGSSFMMCELNAAFLYSQLEELPQIMSKRKLLWNTYFEAFEHLKSQYAIHTPVVPSYCRHNAHIFYLIMPDNHSRNALLNFLKSKKVEACFHYIPLHNSPAGKKFGRTSGELQFTHDLSERIVRLPLYAGMGLTESEIVIQLVFDFCLQYFSK